MTAALGMGGTTFLYRPCGLEQTWVRNKQVGKLGMEVQVLETSSRRLSGLWKDSKSPARLESRGSWVSQVEQINP